MTAASIDLGIERKYALPNAAYQTVLEWLRGACAPDPEFAVGTISSLYYDSSDLRLYGEKLNSDYIKTKLRLRWYADLARLGDADEVPCFFEVKRKVGATRQKQRVALSLPAGELRRPFTSPRLLEAPACAPELGYQPGASLLPVAVISYQRHRFVDAVSGSRISLDFDIACPAANPAVLPHSGPARLDEAVLEVKSQALELPMVLLPLRRFLCQNAFSKYARCLERLMQPGGVRL